MTLFAAVRGLFSRRNGLVWLVAVGLALAGCNRYNDADYQEEFLAFGTLVSVTLHGVDRALADKAIASVREDLNYMHDAWHPWQPGPLGRVNQLLPLQGRFSMAPSLHPVIVQSIELSRQSGGLFNPAIGELVKLWGFSQDEPPSGPPPDARAIAELVARQPSMDDLIVDGITLQATNPALQLDFGAFAKGYGVDRVIEHLRELGVKNAIVNAGGDLRAIGAKGVRPWRIGIRHPRGQGVLASVEVSGDESVFTSGDYERFYEYEGKRYHHIIDPRTGYPARGVVSVTVVHRSAAVADAAATALFVAGPEDWKAVAEAMGVTQVMLVDEAGQVHMSPAMAARIHFETQPGKVIVEQAS